MKWLVLTQYYAPELGAPQVRLRAFVKELSRRGFDVTVVTGMPNYPAGKIYPGYEGKWRVTETIDGVRVKRTWIYAGAGRAILVRLLNYLSFTLTGAIAVLTGPRPDVLFVEAQPLTLGMVALLMKWLRGVPYVFNVPDLQVQVARNLGFVNNERVLRAAAAVEALLARKSWKVATVTHAFMEHFRRAGVPAGQVTFLPNGADAEELRPAPESTALRQRFGAEGKTVFLYVGTMAPYHGMDTLLDAAALLQHRPDLLFLVIGQGPERPRLEASARERGLRNVVFGDSPYEERRDLYSIAYASLALVRDMAVARQMRPAKVFPSLSCAVPVIYTGAGETADLLTRTGTGVATAPEDPRALADAVLALASDRHARDSMGRAGRALVERDYAWSTIVERWLDDVGLASPAKTADPSPSVPRLRSTA